MANESDIDLLERLRALLETQDAAFVAALDERRLEAAQKLFWVSNHTRHALDEVTTRVAESKN